MIPAQIVRHPCFLTALLPFVFALQGVPAHAQTAVKFASQEVPAGKPLLLDGYWFAAAGERRPAVIALHGCSGLARQGAGLGAQQKRYAKLLNDEGWSVLYVDSFTPRGKKSICSEPARERGLTEENRRLDVYGAVDWLAAMPVVDASRIAVLGWSHGGQTVLSSIDRSAADVVRQPAGLRAAVAFYPGCSKSNRNADYAIKTPLLMLVGELDDWTPAARCQELVRKLLAQRSAQAIELVEYPGSYHAFDSAAPVRIRDDVPNGAKHQPVHVGGNPAAREDSARRLVTFLQTHLN